MTPCSARSPRDRYVLLAWLFVIATLTTSCAADPAERYLTRLEALNALLEAHKSDPEVLLDALAAFTDEHREAWVKDRADFEALGEDRRARLTAKYDSRVGAAMLRLIDLTGEIQDRLRSDPDKLARFLALLREVSAES